MDIRARRCHPYRHILSASRAHLPAMWPDPSASRLLPERLSTSVAVKTVWTCKTYIARSSCTSGSIAYRLLHIHRFRACKGHHGYKGMGPAYLDQW